MRQDGVVKQLPLCFALMSGRKRHDYVAVLRKLLEVLPQPPRVEQVVTDFERALWKAVASVMAWVGHRGCGFHWGQAVWRKIAEVGLQTAYQSDDAVYRYLRKLLALPFLPADSITTVFGQLEADATTPKLIQVTSYIRATWIDDSIWLPAVWSVFGQPIRTNNDCEGWHYRLNHRAERGNLNMYLLFTLLHDEAQMAVVMERLLSDRKVRRSQRKASRTCQAKLFRLWDEYEAGNRSVTRLLHACAHLYAPRR